MYKTTPETRTLLLYGYFELSQWCEGPLLVFLLFVGVESWDLTSAMLLLVLKSSMNSASLILYSYKDILVTMAANVLEKIQFHCNNIELSDIDDDTIDEVSDC